MSLSAALFDRQTMKPQARSLLQFKAGKMTLKEDHRVHADTRKGCAYLYQVTGDQSVHFCWFDRRTGLIEENYVLSPKEAEFKHVPQCTSGRVFVLKLKENQRRLFLWMQEPNANNDSHICETVNKFINSPPAPPSASDTAGGASHMVDLFGGVRGLSSLSQSELIALLSMGVGLGSGLSFDGESSSTPALRIPASRHLTASHVEAPVLHTASPSAAPTVPAPSSEQPGRLQLQDLHSILSSIKSPNERTLIDLTLGLDAECMLKLLEDSKTAERLAAHLPPPDPEDRQLSASESVLTNIRSAQFQSALKSFSDALQSGYLGSAISHFGMNEDVVNAAATGDLEVFASSMQNSSSSSNKSSKVQPENAEKQAKEKNDKDTDDYEKMDTS